MEVLAEEVQEIIVRLITVLGCHLLVTELLIQEAVLVVIVQQLRVLLLAEKEL
jgi:hypothetical protein